MANKNGNNYIDLVRAVGRLEGALGNMTTQIQTIFTDHEKRINALETSRDISSGKKQLSSTLLSYLLGSLTVVIAWVAFFFGKK